MLLVIYRSYFHVTGEWGALFNLEATTICFTNYTNSNGMPSQWDGLEIVGAIDGILTSKDAIGRWMMDLDVVSS